MPFGAPNDFPGSLFNTEYRSAIDVTKPRYYFELTSTPTSFGRTFRSFNLEGSPVLVLDPQRRQPIGQRHQRLKPANVLF